ncbi:DUF305 domain-containing protein [Bordetella genomosp. 5]|uniref:DUF4142 domain-containing protein n=1 Tax=Bordetella genomosp. 5 TaxID=1395608 RepID=UPI000B9EEB62|nr:DUF4142 domain-containing protein [Bordetella genomosp. 5]OZI42472.1 DUF305 domain-containing protein [Bordetella genomosp. 5]
MTRSYSRFANLRTLALGVAVSSALTLAPQAHAQSQSQPASTGASAAHDKAVGQLAGADKDFLENAAQSGHFELEGSKLALTKSSNADVKAFAQKMVDDHGKVGAELAALASKKGYEAPTGPSLMQQAKLKTLDMSDDGFDKRYAEMIAVTAHEDAVTLFRKASEEAKDPEVKAFAAKVLPTLKEHLTQAQALQSKVGGK